MPSNNLRNNELDYTPTFITKQLIIIGENTGMYRLFILFVLIISIAGLYGTAQSGFYLETAHNTVNLYKAKWSLGNLGYSLGGYEWTILSFTFGDRLTISPGLFSHKQRMSNNVVDYDWLYNEEIWEKDVESNGEGWVFLPTSIQYPIYAFGNDTASSFKPMYFSISPFLETALFGEHIVNVQDNDDHYDNPESSTIPVFPYLDLGIKLESSVLYMKIGYSLVRNATNSVETTYHRRVCTGNSGLFLSAGINLSFMEENSVHTQRVKYNKKIPAPIIQATSYDLRGSSPGVFYDTDDGYLNLMLKNSGKTDGVNLLATLKPKGSYPGFNIGNPFHLTIMQGDFYNASIPINTRNALPGDKYLSLELSSADNKYKAELPITVNVMSKPQEASSSKQVVYYDPSELDQDIPQKTSKNPLLKAVLIVNEYYKDSSIEPIRLGANTTKTLKKYLTSTLGIESRNIFEFNDSSIAELEDIFAADGGAISKIVGSGDQLLVYILAHGITKEINNNPVSYILGSDSSPFSDRRVGVSQRYLITQLEEIPMKDYVLLVDACYSGLGKGTLAPTIRKKAGPLSPLNGVVITSSEGDEVSNLIEDKGHTVFSYHLMKSLKKLGKSNKEISVQSIFDEIGDRNDGIPGYTLRQYNRIQTPSKFGSKHIILSK